MDAAAARAGMNPVAPVGEPVERCVDPLHAQRPPHRDRRLARFHVGIEGDDQVAGLGERRADSVGGAAQEDRAEQIAGRAAGDGGGEP
jgi:hypothetical protein